MAYAAFVAYAPPEAHSLTDLVAIVGELIPQPCPVRKDESRLRQDRVRQQLKHLLQERLELSIW